MVSFLLILRTDARVDQSNFTGNFPSPQPPEPLFLSYHCFFGVFWILSPGRQGTEQKDPVSSSFHYSGMIIRSGSMCRKGITLSITATRKPWCWRIRRNSPTGRSAKTTRPVVFQTPKGNCEKKIEPSGDLMIQIMQETGGPEMAYAAMVSYAELGGE